MTKNEAISTIENLYPADSDIESIAAIGRGILKKVKEDHNWRNEPLSILVSYAKGCMDNPEVAVRKISESIYKVEQAHKEAENSKLNFK